MIERSDVRGNLVFDAQIAAVCLEHGAATLLTEDRDWGTLLEVSFPDLVADPEPVIAKLAELLPGRLTPAPAVAACVMPALFRTAGEPDQSTGSIDRINRSDQ